MRQLTGYDLDPEAIHRALLAQLQGEGLVPSWLCWMKPNKEIMVYKAGRIPSDPSIERIIFAQKACRKINDEVTAEGGWVIGWANWRNEIQPNGLIMRQPARLWVIAKDRDGDVSCMFDDIRAWRTIYAEGIDSILEACHQALEMKNKVLRDAEVNDNQKVQLAKGQDAGGAGAPDIFTDMI